MAEYEPLMIERAEGCTLVDIDGRALSRRRQQPVVQRPRPSPSADRRGDSRAARQGGPCHAISARRTRRRSSWPSGWSISPRRDLAHVFFSDDGATAVEVALKMAFQYWRQRHDPRPEKTTLRRPGRGLSRRHAGERQRRRRRAVSRHVSAAVVRSAAAAGAGHLSPAAGRVARERLRAIIWRQVEQLLAEQHDEIAAVVIEPLVQAAAGMVMHPPGYLRGVRELTRRYDVLLIADEVAVGFGRTGTMFACEHEDVSPDFLCLAKGLTGGYLPMAATLATDEIWQAFLGTYAEGKTFFHGHTYGGNPLGAAVALATLDVFDEEQTLDALAAQDRPARRSISRASPACRTSATSASAA